MERATFRSRGQGELRSLVGRHDIRQLCGAAGPRLSHASRGHSGFGLCESRGKLGGDRCCALGPGSQQDQPICDWRGLCRRLLRARSQLHHVLQLCDPVDSAGSQPRLYAADRAADASQHGGRQRSDGRSVNRPTGRRGFLAARQLLLDRLTTKMIMTATFSHRLRTLLVVCIATLVVPVCISSARAQTVVVMVNGEPITDYDIEQRSKLDFLSSHKKPTRQDVINELIDEKVEIKEAKKYGVDPSGSNIDQAYGEMAG